MTNRPKWTILTQVKYFLALGIDVPEAASAIYKNEEVTAPPD